jgi:hypothetical protein
MPSPLMKKGDESRPESLQKNLYKIETPYDLTDDIVTKSLNLLQNITGYDYRNSPVLDIVERLVDAANSKLVVIGGQRLLVEFGRRAATNLLDKFIPTPDDLSFDNKLITKNDFKKNDASITDITKNPDRGFQDRFLQRTIGYRESTNFLDAQYGKVKNPYLLSDINYFYLGDMVKEKIIQLNKNSVFSNHNVTKTSKIEFNDQSLIFKNTYSEDFINQNPIDEKGLYGFNILTETFTKTYFKPYENPNTNSLIKDYIQERKGLEGKEGQGFGYLQILKSRETNTDTIELRKFGNLDDLDFDGKGEDIRLEEVGDGKAETFRYDSNTSGQNLLNKQFGVRRGLVYFTSKLAKENNIIAHNEKKLFDTVDADTNIVYYKGNGACRTFTLYDQYDNYSRLIKFDGNGEKNSVLRDSVLPKIAPVVGDDINDKYRYFFTMENLAVKPARYGNSNDAEDCDLGPNGGKWMWFVPYNVKLSDNNSVNWSDMNFLGRPEPIFSYQNTTRSLSLSFSLLIDTVKNIQDVSPTIQNYYNYLYACNTVDYDYDDSGIEPQDIPKPKVKPRKRKTQPVFFKQKSVYYFKNDYYGVKTENIDYTSGDSGEESEENQTNKPENGEQNKTFRPEDRGEDPLSSLTYNNDFLKDFTAATKFIFNNYDNVEKFKIDIQGYASELFRRNGTSFVADKYNSDLGYRRAYGMMQTMIEYINDNSSGKIKLNVPPTVYLYNKPFNKTLIYNFKTDKVTFEFNLKSKGSSKASGNSTFKNRNEIDEVQDRRVELSLITGYMKPSEDTKPIPPKPTQEEKDAINKRDVAPKKGLPCDPLLTLNFEEIKKNNKFPVGFEKLNTFTPSFNSQTPFDFTKRYVFLHQLTRPSKLNNITSVDNTVFGRMPVFVIRYGDFIYSKAIARSINFDIQESTWDLNPEGMGVIPLMCNITMDLTLLGGQSLAGPIDRIQTANDSSFIANTSFNSGKYEDNKRFTSSRRQERRQYPKRSSGEDKASTKIEATINTNPTVDPVVQSKASEERETQAPFIGPIYYGLPNPTRNQIIEEGPILAGQRNFIGPLSEDEQKAIKIDQQAKNEQEQKENEAEEARINSMQSPVRINPLMGF